jgi:hypothetical protein
VSISKISYRSLFGISIYVKFFETDAIGPSHTEEIVNHPGNVRDRMEKALNPELALKTRVSISEVTKFRTEVCVFAYFLFAILL